MSGRSALRARITLLATLLLSALGTRSVAQFNEATQAPLKEPVNSWVYQRDANDRAAIRIVPQDDSAKVTWAELARDQDGTTVDGVTFVDGTLVGVPMGGPYSVQGTVKIGDREQLIKVGWIYVGDLWVLAGQSNMEGVGDLLDVTPPNDRVMLLGMDGAWDTAKEPLHWLVDSPDPVHSGDPATREERSKKAHRERAKGTGLGLPFGTIVARSTGVPIGLVACAHGGTSMAEWDPAKKDEGGKSLYGSMLRQVGLAGGKVKGVLWYQGEAEANPEASRAYPKLFADFIAAVRSDFGQPDLPFYLVQIGRFVHDGDPKAWNAVQEAQRLIPERVGNTAVVAGIDLELDDAIHVGTQGLKRLGARLARVALREVYGQPGGTTPTLDRVFRGPGKTLIVKFKGVNLGPSRPAAATLPGLSNVPAATLGGPSTGAGANLVGLRPSRHVAGFSIRKDDGTEVPLIFEAMVGPSKNTVILKLAGDPPGGTSLWYGWGYDPICNLTDAHDMAVPVSGPVPLDDVK